MCSTRSKPKFLIRRRKHFASARRRPCTAASILLPEIELFLFASENEGGAGLIAFGKVASATALRKEQAGARETPRVSLVVTRLLKPRKRLGRKDLKAVQPMERWPARDGVELQVLSSGDEQNRRHLRSNGRVSGKGSSDGFSAMHAVSLYRLNSSRRRFVWLRLDGNFGFFWVVHA